MKLVTGDELASGTAVGPYRIEDVLGRGGMGVVYRATHVGLGRTVALKVISPHLARDPAFRARFEREARAAAALEHPNLVTVYDYASGDDGGTAYLAMRLIAGTDLAAHLAANGRLATDEVTQIARGVAAALDAAHAEGLVHRDVKPANVLLAREGSGFRAYLTDFGLITGLQAATNVTQQGTWMGTLGYVAPEQLQGRTVDRRADVYALACVLYEALTGVAPFPGDSQAAVLFAHVAAERPSVRKLRPELPEAVDDAIRRGLAVDPADRFGSAGELSGALERALGTQAAGGTVIDRPAAGGTIVGTLVDQAPPPPPAAPTPPAAAPARPAEPAAAATPSGPGSGRKLPSPAILAGVAAAVLAVLVLVVVLATRGGDDGGPTTEVVTTVVTAPAEEVAAPADSTAPAESSAATSAETAPAVATGPDLAAEVDEIVAALGDYFATNGPPDVNIDQIAVSADAVWGGALVGAPGLDPVAVTLAQTSGVWQVLELGPAVNCESLPPDVTSLLGSYCA